MKWFFGSDRENEALVKDLKRLVSGKVLGDEISRIAYSVSPSSRCVKPLVIVQPKDKSDVVKVVKYAASKGVSITPRGSGTSLSGKSVGEGIVLDFSPLMNQVVEFDPDEQTAWVQPGLLRSSLNQFLKPRGLFFPVDPSIGGHCTLGGMIGNNAIGSHSAKYGSTGDHVLDLEVVLSNGEVIPTGPLSLRGREMRELVGAQSLEGEIYRTLPDLLKRYGKVLKSEKPFVLRNSAIYNLWHVKKGQSLNLTPLLVGSEGTLGIITEAKLRLAPLPGKPLFVLVDLDDLDQVSPAVEELRDLGAVMVRILERSVLDLFRNDIGPYPFEKTEVLLVVEFEESRAMEVEGSLGRLTRRLGTRFEARMVQERGEAAALEKMINIPLMVSGELLGSKRPVTVLNDAALHPSRLSACLKGLRETFKQEGVKPVLVGSGGDGTLQIGVQIDPSSEGDAEKILSLAKACSDVVLGLKGTITFRHGDEQFKTSVLRRHFPGLYAAREEVKTLFDPRNLFNPNGIVGKDDLERSPRSRSLSHRLEEGKGFVADPVVRQRIRDCSGCGRCRAFCPIARTLQEEWATPRAKVALLREGVSRGLDSKGIDGLSLRRVMEHCLNCRRCLTECPMKIDGAWIALQGKVPLTGRFEIAFSEALCKVVGSLSTLGKGMTPHSWRRIVLEKMVGLDHRRHLGDSKRQSFPSTRTKRSLSPQGRSVVYLSRGYGGFPRQGENVQAILDVLERNGFDVIIREIGGDSWPRMHKASNRGMREVLVKTMEGLAPFVEEGLNIVFSDPRVASTIKFAYPAIVHSEKARMVAAQSYDVHQFLMMLHDRGELCLELGEMNRAIGYHHPCHLRALGIDREPLALLALIPGLKVQALGEHCCGMGGTFGIVREHFDLSMAIGEALFEVIKELNVEEVATSCPACRLQIFQGTGRRAMDPISLFADAYRRRKDEGRR